MSALFGITFLILLLTVLLPRYKKLCIWVLIIFTIGDASRSFYKFNPFVSKRTIFPDVPVLSYLQEKAGYSRFYGYGNAAIQANFATQYKIFSSDGYDPLYPKEYGSFIHASEHGKLVDKFTTETRSDAEIVPGFGDISFTANSFRLKVLDMLGVVYILDRTENGSTAERFPPSRFPIIYKNNGWIIYKNVLAAPRAFFADSYQTYSSKKEFEEKFFSSTFDVRKSILLEVTLPKKSKKFSLGKASIDKYTPNELSIKTENNNEGLLFLSDTNYPGWNVFIDGEQSSLYKANYAFRAVIVPGGSHTVRFIYKPFSFKLGVIISVISFLLLFLIPVAMLKTRKLSYN
jgi:hypothetical protein